MTPARPALRGDAGRAGADPHADDRDRRGADPAAGRAAPRRARSPGRPTSSPQARRQSVSYVVSKMVSGGVTTIVDHRVRASRPYVPDVDRSSNGDDDLRRQALPLLLPHDPGARAAAAAAGEREVGGVAPVPRRPAARGARRRGVRGRARRSSSPARSCGPCAAWRRRATPSPPARRPTPLPEEGARELASLAQAFNEMAAQLATSRESERNFLLSVSHELKTPLTAIRGYAEGLARGRVHARGGLARRSSLESRRLERLVRDLLDLARMNRHEFSVSREPVDLAEVAREAVARHEAAAREFGVALAAERRRGVGRGRPRPGAPGRLEPVENALRETPRGGAVTVRADAARLMRRGHGPGPRARRPAARVRPLLPLRQVRPRAAGRERARPRDREAARPRRWAGRCTVGVGAGRGATLRRVAAGRAPARVASSLGARCRRPRSRRR